MPEFVNFLRLQAALGLTVSLLAAAQAPLPPMNDAERARRDAEKVFSFIKFQTVRSKPGTEPASKPAKPPAPSAERPARAARPAEAVAAAAGTEPANVAATPAAEPMAEKADATTMLAVAATAAAPPANTMATPPAEADAEPDDHDQDEAALQMQTFVAPVLTPAVQATLGAGSRNIRVRFTVEANGTVSSAEAAAGVPRRLARPATDAILQWQFAPLPQARTADVDIAFRRD